jgi:hypothetical protein
VKHWTACLVGLLVFGTAVQAHHSIAAIYDSSRQVTVEGVVAQFHFVNPHPFVAMTVRDGTGTEQQWRLEMDNRSELTEIGVTSQTLKEGDRVVVTGSPARRQPYSLYVRRLERPADGFQYEQVGASPRIRHSTGEKR